MAHTVIYPLGNAIIGTGLRLFSRYRVEGREAVPPYGPLLVVSNHLSNVDPPLLAVSIPRRLHFLAKRGLFHNPLVNRMLRGYGAFPINLDGHDIQSVKWALRILEQDQALVVFPEGTRSPGGLGQPISGIALLHLRSQAPILPVAITGTEHLGPIWRIFFPTGTITVRIGQPFTLPSLEGKISRDQLNHLTEMIMRRVADLLPPPYRGVYSGAASPLGHSSSPAREPRDDDTPLL